MCTACVKLMKSHKEWHQIDYVRSRIAECETHPVITNRRVIRALKTVKAFSLEPAGMTVLTGGISPSGQTWGGKALINTGGGHVHQRTLLLKLFDYEAPMIDHLVQEGYLARHKGVRYIDEVIPTTVTVTKAGDDVIRQSNLLAEVTNDKSPLTP
jgi:hypothetical protein